MVKVKELIMIAVTSIVMTGAMQTVDINAGTGSLVTDAVEMVQGQVYSKSWTKYDDHLNHYSKFTISERGLVSFDISKPSDSEGEYGTIKFTLYNEAGTAIWSSKAYKGVENISPSYKYNIGLAPGTYYFTLIPGFTVTSGVIDTNYSYSFASGSSYEIEPNESSNQATEMALGTTYIGYIGNDYGDYGENDYYKFNAIAGKTYRITYINYDVIDSTTAILKGSISNGGDLSLSYKFGYKYNIDASGNRYVDYTPTTSGTIYIDLYNYSGEQLQYGFCVTDVTPQQQPTVTPQQQPTVTPQQTTTAYSYDDYKDSEELVQPAKAKITKLKKLGKGKVKITLKKTKYAKSYQIVYSLKKSFSNKKTKNTKKTSVTIKNLKKGKTYYFKVRAINSTEDGEMSIDGKWSAVKKIKVK